MVESEGVMLPSFAAHMGITMTNQLGCKSVD